MKHILNYIVEKLYIKKHNRPIANQNDLKESINELQTYANNKKLTVKFRNRKTDQGDFCIFIYDKSKQSRYLIGYDGYWEKYPEYSFEKCFDMALDYIDNY